MDRQGQGAYIPQELLKELSKASNRLLIGIPCERVEGERRLALTPEAVDMLTDRGHRVLVEAGAGLGINYSDNHYSEAGAEIVATPAVYLFFALATAAAWSAEPKKSVHLPA